MADPLLAQKVEQAATAADVRAREKRFSGRVFLLVSRDYQHGEPKRVQVVAEFQELTVDVRPTGA